MLTFQNGILFWHILHGPVLSMRKRIGGFKSPEFLQNKASLRQFLSEKHPIMALMEILFPASSLHGHSLSTLEYISSTENKYTQ